jgi:hypothetical protein
MQPAPGCLLQAGTEEMPDMAKDRGRILELIASGHELRQASCRPSIVGIQKGQIRPPRDFRAAVAGGADPGIRLANGLDSRMVRSSDLEGAVCRSVVDDDDLDGWTVLETKGAPLWTGITMLTTPPASRPVMEVVQRFVGATSGSPDKHALAVLCI